MKKTLLRIVAGAAIIGFATSCSISRPVAVSDQAIGSKKGTSETAVVLGIRLNSNYGIKEAAKKGKITGGISTVDEKFTAYGAGVLFHQLEMTVTGE